MKTTIETIEGMYYVAVEVNGKMPVDEFLLSQIERGIRHGKKNGRIEFNKATVRWDLRFRIEEIQPGTIIRFSTSGKYNSKLRSTMTYRGEVMGVKGTDVIVKTDVGEKAIIKMHHIDRVV